MCQKIKNEKKKKLVNLMYIQKLILNCTLESFQLKHETSRLLFVATTQLTSPR